MLSVQYWWQRFQYCLLSGIYRTTTLLRERWMRRLEDMMSLTITSSCLPTLLSCCLPQLKTLSVSSPHPLDGECNYSQAENINLCKFNYISWVFAFPMKDFFFPLGEWKIMLKCLRLWVQNWLCQLFVGTYITYCGPRHSQLQGLFVVPRQPQIPGDPSCHWPWPSNSDSTARVGYG